MKFQFFQVFIERCDVCDLIGAVVHILRGTRMVWLEVPMVLCSCRSTVVPAGAAVGDHLETRLPLTQRIGGPTKLAASCISSIELQEFTRTAAVTTTTIPNEHNLHRKPAAVDCDVFFLPSSAKLCDCCTVLARTARVKMQHAAPRQLTHLKVDGREHAKQQQYSSTSAVCKVHKHSDNGCLYLVYSSR